MCQKNLVDRLKTLQEALDSDNSEWLESAPSEAIKVIERLTVSEAKIESLEYKLANLLFLSSIVKSKLHDALLAQDKLPRLIEALSILDDLMLFTE